jgi:hypothetical protein
MTKRTEAKIRAAVQGDLRPCETVDVVAAALRNMKGPGGLISRGRQFGMVLTDGRLLFVEVSQRTGKMRGIAEQYPRADVRVLSAPKGLLAKTFRIVDRNGNQIAKLTFPLMDRPACMKLAGALGAPP